jgi:hypothetical protein
MRRGVAIFGAGLAFRLVVISYLAHVKPYMLLWRTNEAGAIARWIVTNHAFSSPFHDASGPTAWLGPIYPLIISGCFLVFGVQTSASAVAVMVFNAVCSAAAGVIAYEIGKEVYSEKAGLFAGWMWAFSSYVAVLPFLLWDTSLSALLLGSALLLTLRLYSGKGDWTACGNLGSCRACQSGTACALAGSGTVAAEAREVETGLHHVHLYSYHDSSMDRSELCRLP